MRKWLGVVATIGLGVGGLVVGFAATAPARAEAVAAATTRFVPLASPTRLVDSRTGLGTEKTPLPASTPRDVQITGGVVPAGAASVLINVTVANTTAGGWLQVFPTGRAAIGSSSTLNLDFGGVTLPNASFAQIGDGGKVTLYATFGTDFIIDVFGYFEPAVTSNSGRFISVAPTRILDTRTRLGWAPASPGDVKDCSSFATQAAAQEWFDAYFDLYGDVAHLDADGDKNACEPDEQSPTPPVTPPVTPPANPGDSKNCSDFKTYAEAKAWFDTYFPYYGDVAHLDANGDGRPCESLPGGPSAIMVARPDGKVLGGTTVTLQVTGNGGVPLSGVSAVVLNVTAVGPKSEGWIQVAPNPVSIGASSNLNTTPGVTVANLVVVPVSATGKVDLYSTTGGDLLADVFGYFTSADANSTSFGLFVPVAPIRALDTRPDSGNQGIGAGTTRFLDLAQYLPGATAFTGNLTSTNSKVNGYLQLAPHPVTIGAHSNLNTSYDGQTVANAVVSPLPATGLRPIVGIYTLYNADVLLDITGYFVGTS